MRFLICDIRRLFTRKGMVVLFILAPVAVMLLFAGIIVPMLFTGRGLYFNLALYQEDDSLEVRSFVHHITHGEAVSELTRITEVASLAEGEALLRSQQVSVLVHIPADILIRLRQKETVTIEIYGTRAHAMEKSLIAMTLGQALGTIGQSQNQLDAMRNILLARGVPQAEADDDVRRMTIAAIATYMDRRQVLGSSGTVSPLGEYLPVEYYLAAVYALFAALAMLPLVYLTAADISGAILHRGLASGRSVTHFYLSRLCSGTLFILPVLFMVYPTSLLLKASDALIGGPYNGNLAALTGVIFFGAVCLSTLAATLACLIGKTQPAVWAGFYLILGMSVAGGALIPDGALPSGLAMVGRWLPLRLIMRGLANALFDFDPVLYLADLSKLAFLAAVLFLAGLLLIRQKERGR